MSELLDVGPIEFQTDHGLTMREMTMFDAAAQYELIEANRKKLTMFDPEISCKFLSVQDAMEIIEYTNSHDLDTLLGIWGTTGTLIGNFYLTHWAQQTVEFAYLIDRGHWKRGYATAAVRRMTDHAFGTLGKEHIFAKVCAENKPSRRTLEKAGFEHKGVYGEYLRYTLDKQLL